MIVLLGQLAHDPERVVEVAVHGHDPRSGDQRLEELADRDRARGQHDDAFDAGAAAYAAAEADVLPVDAQMIERAPASSAFATASTMPRSLNDPVGFAPSILR